MADDHRRESTFDETPRFLRPTKLSAINARRGSGVISSTQRDSEGQKFSSQRRFTTLRTEEFQIVKVFNQECLKQARVFHDCSKEFVDMLTQFVSNRVFVKDDLIFNQGEQGDSMFILNRGEVTVHVDSCPDPVARLCDGAVFGEMSAIARQMDCRKRTATLKAATLCDCRVIDRTALMRTMARFPADAAIIEAEASKRLNDLKKQGLVGQATKWYHLGPLKSKESLKGMSQMTVRQRERAMCTMDKKNMSFAQWQSFMAMATEEPPPSPRPGSRTRALHNDRPREGGLKPSKYAKRRDLRAFLGLHPRGASNEDGDSSSSSSSAPTEDKRSSTMSVASSSGGSICANSRMTIPCIAVTQTEASPLQPLPRICKIDEVAERGSHTDSQSEGSDRNVEDVSLRDACATFYEAIHGPEVQPVNDADSLPLEALLAAVDSSADFRPAQESIGPNVSGFGITEHLPPLHWTKLRRLQAQRRGKHRSWCSVPSSPPGTSGSSPGRVGLEHSRTETSIHSLTARSTQSRCRGVIFRRKRPPPEPWSKWW